jgi:uncharacterized protein involved in exopolysaccharide biosynthesis
VRIHRSSGAHEVLLDHVKRVGDQLSKTELQLVELKTQTGLASPVEQRSVLVERLGTLKSELFLIEAALAESQAEVNQLTESLAKITAGEESTPQMLVGAMSEEADGMRTRLYQLQLEAEASLSRYSEDHVKAKRLRAQIAAAKSLLATQEATLEIQQRMPFLVSQRAKADKLNEQIAEVESELVALNKNEMAIAQLERSVEIHDATFREVSQNAETSRIANSLEQAKITNISVVQPATRDLYPVFPNTKLNLIVALFVAMFVSTGVAVLAESRKTSTPVRRSGITTTVSQNGQSQPEKPEPAESTESATPEAELSLSKPR